MPKTLFVIDGHALAYRAFFSIPNSLILPDGQLINAVYGFIALMFKGFDQFQPDYACVCFDRKEETFRKKWYPQYKANRPAPPETFIAQLPILYECLQQLSIPIFELAGFEADDLMGTLSKTAEDQSIETLLMTGDRDAFQLITDHTKVVLNKKGLSEFQIYSPQKLFEKYQLKPIQIIDLKALQGDSSDNIPGVLGIGEKTAQNLLMHYHSLDNIYQNLDDIQSKNVKQKLANDRDNAYLSYKLATINCQAPIEIDFEKIRFQPNWTQIIDCFQKYQFQSLVQKYQSRAQVELHPPLFPDTTQQETVHYESITTAKLLGKLIPQLKTGFALDLETTSLFTPEAQIVGISISIQEKSAFYIPLNRYLTAQTSSLFPDSHFELNPFLKTLQPILENEKIPKYTHNGKYEYRVLLNYGIELKGITFDTLLAGYLLYPGERLGLKSLTNKLLNIQPTTYEDLTGKGKKQISFSAVPIDQATSYACADADHTLRLKNSFEPQIKSKKLDCLYYEIELPLQIVLAKIEQTGVSLHTKRLHQLSKDFQSQSEQIQKEIFRLSGCEFNINSPKQLSDVLFNQLKLPTIKKIQTGFSTDSSVLEKLAIDYPIAQQLLRFRTLEKLQNTYINALPKLICYKTQKIHTSFNQTVTVTGRLSSTHPNLQNIPIRTEEGRKIRSAFIPSTPTNKILSADYSQIELRIMASLAQADNMIDAFTRNEDIHTNTAAAVFNVPVSQVSKELRYQAKAINFGIIYGISAYGLSQQLSIKRQDAQQIIDQYFEKFPKIKQFMEETIQATRQKGYVMTEFGRYRPIPDIHSNNPHSRSFAERTAINTRVQGTAADIIKIAMINLQSQLERQYLKSKMIIQVHDELVLDVVKEELEVIPPLVKNVMQSAAKLAVPLTVDVVIGDNWMEG